jgi:tRNA threonylcarbamoyladenosine biosynthesis protein TsaE
MTDGDPLTIITRSADETSSLGQALGEALDPGDLVLLQGNFGAGKTVLVQGIARGLGIDDSVTSPSFVLIVEHVGAQKLAHVDFFRIERADADLLASVEDYLDGGWVVAIEWPDWLPSSLAGSATIVRLEAVSEDERRITISYPREAIRSAVAHAKTGAGS